MTDPVSVLVERVRTIAARLPRSYEVVVRGRLKFRVGQIVWLSFSHDQTMIGFSFPKELREALVEAEPEKYVMPTGSDLRFNWVHAHLARARAGRARGARRGCLGDSRAAVRRPRICGEPPAGVTTAIRPGVTGASQRSPRIWFYGGRTTTTERKRPWTGSSTGGTSSRPQGGGLAAVFGAKALQFLGDDAEAATTTVPSHPGGDGRAVLGGGEPDAAEHHRGQAGLPLVIRFTS